MAQPPQSIVTAIAGAVVAPTPSQGCANATDIRDKTEALLLGCHICPTPIYTYQVNTSTATSTNDANPPVTTTTTTTTYVIDTNGNMVVTGIAYPTVPNADCGIVSSKMRCNPKGAFCYVNKVDNKCDNSSKLNIDLNLYAEMTVDELTYQYFQQIGSDPRFSRLYTQDEISQICDMLSLFSATLDAAGPLGADTKWPAKLIKLLARFLDKVGCSYSLPQEPQGGFTNECGDINLTQLTSIVYSRFQIMVSLDLKLNSSSYKEAQGIVKQEVNISWDFCNAPTIKGCCAGSGKN